jgi:hypothetical protein
MSKQSVLLEALPPLQQQLAELDYGGNGIEYGMAHRLCAQRAVPAPEGCVHLSQAKSGLGMRERPCAAGRAPVLWQKRRIVFE